ncbi:GNAT family N-acetyltransferase [Shouchella patagoniensis]|uniref:GNAT family N-acetyltransferase n=1 Tax=Shouchella patagoniensis TaxID=228576 RepID=UPI000994DB65|nr:GNAT family N-acetyltransferase [Shouchella patagoniensis]
MKYRKATIKDINVLIDLRKKQLSDEGIKADGTINQELHQFFEVTLNDQSLIQLLVEEKDQIIACGAVMFYQFPPTYTNKSGRKAYITNMYTEKEYRGKGIATKILTKLVEETRQIGISNIWLGASMLGRPVYKKFGFTETDEWLELTV